MPSFLTHPLRWHVARQSCSRPPINLAPNSGLRLWLLDKGSLTAKLIALSQGDFRVEVVRQAYARANRSEVEALGIATHSLCLIREVVLMGHGQAWIFARSVLPLSSIGGKLRHLRKQGSRPLGAFLFSQPQLIRSPIALALINSHHGYVPSELIGDNSLWGRRSIFYVAGKPLLVSEVFLPDFPGLSDQPPLTDKAT